MKTITYKLKDLEEKKEKKVTLKLGYVGENEHVQIRIDCAEIWKDYPAAVASLAVEPPEGDKYPAIVTRDGDMVCWTVKDSDLVKDGYGRIQLTFTEGSEVQKTVICRTKVDESIVGSGTAPDPIADFVAEASAAVEAAEDAAEKADAAAEHVPYIGSDGYWYTWDGSAFVKGVKAQGEDGEDGHSPELTAEKVGKTTTIYADGQQLAQILDGEDGQGADVIDDTAGEGDTDKTWSADKIAETTGQLLNAIHGVSDDVDDLLEHETYMVEAEATEEYEPVTPYNTISGAYININAYEYAYISTPSTVDVKVYPVVSGKTYKVKGRGKTDRPVYIVADNAASVGTIAEKDQFEYEYGSSSSLAVEEKEITAQRTGYLYITYSTEECGLWLKNEIQPTEKKYHIDDVMADVADIKNDVTSLNNAVFKTQTDSASALIKRVPRNAEPIAKVKSIANTVTLVRSITGRNLANKDTVGDVDVSGTTKKGIKTIRVPSGRYYVILGNMGVNTKVDKVDGKTHTTLYQDQFPMRLNIIDPSGGYFIVYAGTVSNLGDMSGLMIGKLRDDETTLTFEAYKEKTYTPDDLEADNSIEVRPDGFIEFVNSGNAAVSSSIEYTVSGRGDDSTTRKEFIVSPDGSKFLPMVKDDGSIACARVVPKKALFIGNSLTSGWQTFGEAATEVDKDYIALFGDVVDNIESSYTFSRVWATGFEQQTSLANAQSWTTTNIDPSLSSDLDLIVVQLSENVVDNASAVATFPSSSLWLLEHLRSECPKARVVWMGVWFDRGWVNTLLNNTKKTGCEYIDIRPLYLPENVSAPGTIYKMESDYSKEYTVDSFSVSNGTITLNFTIEGTQYTATIPSYTSYTSGSETSITVTGIYHAVTTYYTYIHPGDEGFRKIANKLLFDLGISDSEETIPADE